MSAANFAGEGVGMSAYRDLIVLFDPRGWSFEFVG